MHEFWYDYIEPKYQYNQYNAKLCHMDTDSFIIHVKTKMFMKTLQIMLKKDLIHQIMKLIDRCLQEKIKK